MNTVWDPWLLMGTLWHLWMLMDTLRSVDTVGYFGYCWIKKGARISFPGEDADDQPISECTMCTIVINNK